MNTRRTVIVTDEDEATAPEWARLHVAPWKGHGWGVIGWVDGDAVLATREAFATMADAVQWAEGRARAVYGPGNALVSGDGKGRQYVAIGTTTSGRTSGRTTAAGDKFREDLKAMRDAMKDDRHG